MFETYGENSLSIELVYTQIIPNGAYVNSRQYPELQTHEDDAGLASQYSHVRPDPTKLQNRRDMAYALQTQTQEEMVKLIRKAVKQSGCNNVVISGGYGLNCVAN